MTFFGCDTRRCWLTPNWVRRGMATILIAALNLIHGGATVAKADEAPEKLVTDGLLAEYRFDDGSGKVLKGYNAAGANDPALNGVVDSGAPPAWSPKGLVFNGSLLHAAPGMKLMEKAKTLLLVTDVAPPRDLKRGQPTLLGTHSGSYKEIGITGDGLIGSLYSPDSWYGGYEAGTTPAVRQQGTLIVTIAFAGDGPSSGKFWYGEVPQKYYIGRGTPRPLAGDPDVVFGMGLGLGTDGTIYYAALWDRVLTDEQVKQNSAFVGRILAKRGVKVGDTIPTDRPLLVFMGDSITVGVGAAYGKSWPNQVSQSLKGAYRDIDAGVSAICVSDWAGPKTGFNSFGPDQIDPLYGIYKAPGSVAVISLGVNDINSYRPAPLLIAALQTRVDQVRAAGASKVAMATITPRSNVKEQGELIRNEVNRAIRDKKITGIDVILDFAADENMGKWSNTTDPQHTYYGDGVHPSQKGHDILAHIAEEGLKTIGVKAK